MKSFTKILVILLIFLVSQNLVAVTNYVSLSGGHISPFTSWANAATNIQAAVEVASSGDMVLVNDGVYDTGERVTPGYLCSNRVVITKDIIVKSVNGPGSTIILGKGPNGDSAVRGVYMSTGILSGFNVSNGHTRILGTVAYESSGGGVNMYSGSGVITNCIISENSAFYYGGGTYYGTINNCIITGNSGSRGGGTYEGSINNCTITGNSGGDYGGGAYKGTINNCIISGNSAVRGGGIYGNGTYEGSVNNCIIIENVATNGGGTSNGTVNNCTISGNLATWGGGTSYSTLNNCIIWDNFASSDGSNYYSATINYSCTIPFPAGNGNISNNPQFVDVTSGNYRLKTNSPCINVGANAYAPMPYDLDENPRIVDDIVDMGAYECPAISVTFSSDKINGIDNLFCTFSSSIYGVHPENIYYRWDFENDGVIDVEGTGEEFTFHNYTSTGTYSVFLLVSNSVGETASCLRENYIHIYSALQAGFSAQPQTGKVALAVQFTDGSINGPQFWNWDFDDDGNIDSTEQNPSYTYNSIGTYTVSLLVSNNFGDGVVSSDFIVKTNYIVVEPNIVAADFSANVQTGAVSLSVHFNDLSINNPQYWEWDFDNDGLIDSTLQNPDFTYDSTGIYTVTLSVSNNFGSSGGASSDTIIKTNYIVVLPLVNADFSPDKTVAVTDEDIQFSDTSENNPDFWFWDFNNDGIIDSTLQNPVTNYSVTGYKTITLIASNQYSFSTVTKTNLIFIMGKTPIHYVYYGGASIIPYTNWLTAATNVQDAINVSENLDRIYISNGVYTSAGEMRAGSNVFCLEKNVEIVGLGMPVIDGQRKMRGAFVSAGKVDGLKFINGLSAGTGNERNGGGVYCVTNGEISRCIFMNNSANYNGGAIYARDGGALKSCLIVSNSANNAGGGVALYSCGTIYNLTLLDNSAVAGGGIYCNNGGEIINTIAYNNSASANNNIYNVGSGWSYSYCCTTPDPGGIGNITDNPLLLDNYKLQVSSPCIDAGSNMNWMTFTEDLAGEPRIMNNTVDIGTYEIRLPFIDITNENTTVNYDVATYTIGGTNNANIVGGMVWSNQLTGVTGTLPATPSWSIADIALDVGANGITVFGTNVYGATVNDNITITRGVPGTGVPVVDVTTTNTTVTFDVTQYTISGINNTNVVGGMTWSNELTGISGPLVAEASWSIENINLDVGNNVIIVSGTNLYGIMTNDLVMITRGIPGTGVPVVDITNQDTTVTYDVTEYTINGTCNANVVGGMTWSNQLTGIQGSLSASSSWTIPNTALDVGINTITVSGTNIYGQSTNSVVSIRRKMLIESAPQIATNALIFPASNSVVLAPYPTNIVWDVSKITDDIDGTNLIITKISVFITDTTNEVAVITNDVSNLLGSIPWRVPEYLIAGDTNYLMRFEVVDSSSLTNSRIFFDNPFAIIPESFYLLFIIYQLLFIGYCRRKFNPVN